MISGLSSQRHNGKAITIATDTEPEIFEVFFTKEEKRKLDNWCISRDLMDLDIARSARGGRKGGITRKAQRG